MTKTTSPWIIGILTLLILTDQTVHFLDIFLIFLSLPHVGWLRKIEKPWKKCIVWSVEMSKVTCIFSQNIVFKILTPYKTSKKYIGTPKKTEIIQKNYLYLISLFDDTSEKAYFFCPKRYHICQIWNMGKGRETLLTECMGLPWRI